MLQKKRKNTPYKLRIRLLQETSLNYPFCEQTKNDPALLQFHHIDGDSSNTVFENMISVCGICHLSIEDGGISLNTVLRMKTQLGISSKVNFYGKYQFVDFSIRENRVSIFAKGMTIEEIYRVLPKEQILKNVGYGEHSGEDSYDNYLIHDYDGNLLLIITPENSGIHSSKIKTVEIKSKKFAAINGTKIGSFFKDVNNAQSLINFTPNVEHIIFEIEWLSAICSINKSELKNKWWNENESEIIIENIDKNSKIENIFIYWGEKLI